MTTIGQNVRGEHTGGAGPFGGLRVDHPVLQPQALHAQGNALIDDGGHFMGSAKHIHEIHRAGDVGEAGVGFFAQHFGNAAYGLAALVGLLLDGRDHNLTIARAKIQDPGAPESFRVLIKELQSLGLSVEVLSADEKPVELNDDVDSDMAALDGINVASLSIMAAATFSLGAAAIKTLNN